MKVLEEKLKVILEKLGEEKRVYAEENERMGAELLEVKDLLTKTLGAGSVWHLLIFWVSNCHKLF